MDRPRATLAQNPRRGEMTRRPPTPKRGPIDSQAFRDGTGSQDTAVVDLVRDSVIDRARVRWGSLRYYSVR